MPEPTYEELKAKLAELETKQQRTGTIQFKVSEKGGAERLRSWTLSRNAVLRTMGSAARCQPATAGIPGRKQVEA